MTDFEKAQKLLYDIGMDPSTFTKEDLSPLIELINHKTNETPDDVLRNAVKGLSQFANVVSNYYLELKRSGFDDEQALRLAIAYQTATLTGNG